VLRNEARAVETEIKFAGYLDQQRKSIEKLKAAEAVAIPEWIDYRAISGLSREMREILERVRPVTIGQASRISGVTPAALSLSMCRSDCRPPGGWQADPPPTWSEPEIICKVLKINIGGGGINYLVNFSAFRAAWPSAAAGGWCVCACRSGAEPNSSRPKAERDMLSFPFVVRGGSNGDGELPILCLSPPSLIVRRAG